MLIKGKVDYRMIRRTKLKTFKKHLIDYKIFQDYLSNPTEPVKEKLIATANEEINQLIEDIIRRMEHLTAEGTRAALFYNPGKEARRAYQTKEITEEEYKNNPLKTAYEEYAEAIPFRVGDLCESCIAKAITESQEYERITDTAINHAEKLISKIQKETVATAEEMAVIASYIIFNICNSSYQLFYPGEDKTEHEIINKYTTIRKKIIEMTQNETNKEIIEKYKKQSSKNDEEFNQKLNEFSKNQIYKFTQAAEILEQILNRIFPEIQPGITQSITERAADALDGYYLLAQSHASNKLTKKLTERITKSEEGAQLDFYGNGRIEEKDFKLFIKGYRELISGVKQSAAMLLDSLMITATKNGLQNTLIKLPIQEYLEMRELTDEKEIRKQVKSDIDALERISFEYKGTGKRRGEWFKVSISGGTVGQIKNGDIIFRFNQDFFDSFKVEDGNRFLYMYFPYEALQGNIRNNPWKYWIARKISEHKRINLGKINADIISVKALIDACPNYPTYEEVIQRDRAIKRRIIEPFERDINALSPSISWKYQNLDESPKTYQEFINAKIIIQWSTYPDTQKIEAGKKKRTGQKQIDKKKK